MNDTPRCHASPAHEVLPLDLMELRERVQALPRNLRSELEPYVEGAVEDARFRGRILSVARDALEQFKLDLDLTRFDLDATRRERESLRQLLKASGGDG